MPRVQMRREEGATLELARGEAALSGNENGEPVRMRVTLTPALFQCEMAKNPAAATAVEHTNPHFRTLRDAASVLVRLV